MFIINLLPDWVFYSFALLGIVGLIVSRFVPGQYRLPAQAASAALLAFGLFMAGAISNNDKWIAKVKELETKLAQVEAESAKANVQIVEKVATKLQIVKIKGDEIIKFVDREVTKHDALCVIPKEFVHAHNKAAEGPQK